MMSKESSMGWQHGQLDRRRLLQGTLALGGLAAVGGLAGCSNEGRGDGGSQVADEAVALPTYVPWSGVTTDLVGQDGVSDAVFAYPAEPVSATDGQPGDGRDVEAFSMTTFPAPPGPQSNEFLQALNERLGFALSVSLVPTGDFSARFQTAVAGDQLPDLFTFFPKGEPGLPGMLQERAVDLTQLLSGDAVTRFPFLANVPTESWRSAVYGGKIYGIPIPRGPQSSIVLYGREDVLSDEGVGMTVASAAELHDLCRDLSGGNRWALDKTPIRVLRQMFEIPNGWSEEGGAFTSALEHERQLDALEAGRALVADGLVHPDALVAPNPQRKAWFVSGTVLLMEDTFSAWPGFHTYEIPEGFLLGTIVPPLADGGGQAPIWLGSPTHNITAVGQRAEDRAESLLEVLDYLAAPFGTAEHLFKNYGLPGVHHTLQGSDPILTEQGKSELQLALRYLGEGPWVTYQAGSPEIARSQFEAQSATVPTAVRNPSLTLFSETESRKGGQIGGDIASVENDILLGRRPVTDWTAAVEAWKRDGGDQIADEFAEALALSAG
jgi:putative aldouronate transport system substrate-binding protein